MSRIRLIAASDDYLLEERLTASIDEVCRAVGGVEPEDLPDETTPEALATELVSPSLFATERVLVVRDARVWLGARQPAGVSGGRTAAPDVEALTRVLTDGVPDGIGLVMGAWCGGKPTGALVDAMAAAGTVEWLPLPPPPKPWEDAVLSDEQQRVLAGVLRRAAGEVEFDRRAVRLLLERLGFAPRLLVQEVRKLTGAAAGGVVDEALVRRLTFPRERSFEVVRDAVLGRRLAPLHDLLVAAEGGAPVNDWRGQRIEPGGFAPLLFAMVSNLLLQLLYLRRIAVRLGIDHEMAPDSTAPRGWYASRFKRTIAPGLLDALVRPGGRPPTPFSLSGLFAGAGRYRDDELAAAVVEAAAVEVRIRDRDRELDSLTAWLSGWVASGAT
jgi:hypothetical protein